MDRLLNTCHASLINIQSSSLSLCLSSLALLWVSPPTIVDKPRRRRRRRSQVESRLIFIDHRSTPLAPRGSRAAHVDGRLHAAGQIRIRHGYAVRRFMENIRIPASSSRLRLATDKDCSSFAVFVLLLLLLLFVLLLLFLLLLVLSQQSSNTRCQRRSLRI